MQFLWCSIAFAVLTLAIGCWIQRVDFYGFIGAYAAFFGLYTWLVFFQLKDAGAENLRHWLWLGVALRVLLLFSIPSLSDDYARFLWDGHLSVAGIHPFAHPPDYFIEHQIFPNGITPELYAKLNSQHYYTVYPPVCQLVFASAVWLFPNSELGGVFVIKLFLLACELGTLWMLSRSENKKAALFYALNPLIILELVGNCHFEAAVICFLLAGLLALQQKKLLIAAFWWSLATASKMIPLLFLPILWRWLGWRKGWTFHIAFGLISLVLFAPILILAPNMLQSLDLYFQKFQFNASIYYLIRELGLWQTGWDIGHLSGPVLGGLTAIAVFFLAFWTKTQANGGQLRDLKQSMVFALAVYLSFSATVQPWYICVPLALAIGGSWHFMIAWSGLAALSYSHYWHNAYLENYPLIFLEYALLWGVFIWDLRRRFVRSRTFISS